MNTKWGINIGILALGTILSQVISFGCLPIISKLYSPYDFGKFSVFSAFVGIFGHLVTGKYEQAIVLSKVHREINVLINICINLVLALLFVSFIIVTVGWCFDIHFYFKVDIVSVYIILLGIASNGIFNTLILALHRYEEYKEVSKLIIIHAIFFVLSSIALQEFAHKYGLMISSILSNLSFITFSFLFLYKNKKIRISLFKYEKYYFIFAYKYKKFPLFTTPYYFILSLNQHFTPVLLSILFSPNYAGYYTMSNRILKAPLLVFTGAIVNVLKNSFANSQNNVVFNIFRKYLKRIFYVSILIFSLIYLTIPFLFKLVFNDTWNDSIPIAKVLCFLVAIEMVENCVNFIYQFSNRHNLQFFIQLFSFLFSSISLWISFKIFNDPFISIIVFAICVSVCNILSIFNIYNLALKSFKK